MPKIIILNLTLHCRLPNSENILVIHFGCFCGDKKEKEKEKKDVPFFWKHSTSNISPKTEPARKLPKQRAEADSVQWTNIYNVCISRSCVYICISYIKLNQSINYLVNRRKCVIITKVCITCAKKTTTF